MPEKSDGEFLLTIYLDEVKCNDPEDFLGDEFVIVGVSQSGLQQDEFDKSNREIRTEIIPAKASQKPYPFDQTRATLFAKRVKPEEYVLVSIHAFDLDFSEDKWNQGAREVIEGLAAVAKKAADEAFKENGRTGVKAGNLVDGNIVSETAKIVLEQIPKVLEAVFFKLDKPDDLGEWAPKRDVSKAKFWKENQGKMVIPFKSQNGKASRSWDYEVTVGVRVED